MAWTRRRFAVLACVAGAVTLAIGIGVATGAKLTTKSADTNIAPYPDTGSATAKCKRGQKVISGGFEAPDIDHRFFETGALPFKALKQGGRKWAATAVNYAHNTALLTVDAYCREGKKLKARSANIDVAPNSEGSATATCKQSERVVSGGFAVLNFEFTETEVLAYRSIKASKRKWTVAGHNYSSGAPGTLVAYAYCREGKGVKTKSASTTVGLPPETGTPTATCASGQRVLSGGFDNPDFADAGGPELLASASRKQGGRKWTASAYNEGNEVGTLTVYAYCEKKKAK
jgi:hypothetical protein